MVFISATAFINPLNKNSRNITYYIFKSKLPSKEPNLEVICSNLFKTFQESFLSLSNILKVPTFYLTTILFTAPNTNKTF